MLTPTSGHAYRPYGRARARTGPFARFPIPQWGFTFLLTELHPASGGLNRMNRRRPLVAEIPTRGVRSRPRCCLSRFGKQPFADFAERLEAVIPVLPTASIRRKSTNVQ